ncbi:MAG TPA: hypothetical protein VNT77_02905 [Allosphingosinicella sp.]|nr:hypothetical protein [Allosphingosinicella sp.]
MKKLTRICAAALLALASACGSNGEANNEVNLPEPSGPPVVQQVEPETGPEVPNASDPTAPDPH